MMIVEVFVSSVDISVVNVMQHTKIGERRGEAMSIYETVVCDYCGDVSKGPTAPDSWITADGEHFDTKYCAMTYWNYYDKGEYIGGLI